MIIQNIPTETFNTILKSFIDEGWVKSYLYDGIDAWIDYGKVVLRYTNRELVFEWDNWCEGLISGEAVDIEEIANRFNLEITLKQ